MWRYRRLQTDVPTYSLFGALRPFGSVAHRFGGTFLSVRKTKEQSVTPSIAMNSDQSLSSARTDGDGDAEDNHGAFVEQFDRLPAIGGVAVRPIELLLGVVALAAWFILFAGGVLIGTTSHRENIASPESAFTWLQSFTIVFFFWTITNVGILSCIAAFLGALGRRTRFTMTAMANDTSAPAPPGAMTVAVFYISAIMRGFGIYALAFAGLLVLATQSFQNPDQGAYLRLAATLSVTSFYGGYDPETFAGLLDRVKQFFQVKPKGK